MSKDENENSKITDEIVCEVKQILSENISKFNTNEFRIIACPNSLYNPS